MQKILFLDSRDLELADGFTRRFEQPVKDAANPLFLADEPWENGNMQLYGSVLKRPHGPFQLWYSCIQQPWNVRLAYAESDDGLNWRKPELGIVEQEGRN